MKCLLFGAIVVLIIVSGDALNCYHCIEVDKPFNASSLSMPCSFQNDLCAKITNKLKNGTEIVIRGCYKHLVISPLYLLWTMEPIGISSFRNEDLNFSCNHFCDTDNCNGAQSIVAIFSIIFSSIVLSVFASY